jgi:hypothetical protein
MRESPDGIAAARTTPTRPKREFSIPLYKNITDEQRLTPST